MPHTTLGKGGSQMSGRMTTEVCLFLSHSHAFFYLSWKITKRECEFTDLLERERDRDCATTTKKERERQETWMECGVRL